MNTESVIADVSKPKRRMPAIYFDLSREDYESIPCVNWSSLKHMQRSPLHYRHNLLTPRTDTAGLKRGRVGHLAVLEPERFLDEVVVWPGGVRRGKEWDAFTEKHGDKEIMTTAEIEACRAIADAVHADAEAAKWLSGGRAEVSVTWTHKVPAVGGLSGFSVDCKARPDFVSDRGALVDLKTTQDASPDAFGRACWTYRYLTQAAWYCDGYEAATGQRLPFFLVAVESSAPHAVQVYRVPDAILAQGRQEYRALLERLAVCRRESRWPGYADGEMELQLPSWAMPRDEDDVGDILSFGGADAT